MKPAEAAMVLAAASGVDNRKHGELQAKVWARILGDTDLRDALEAVEIHYATSDKFLMPVHVIEGAKRCRDDRLGRERRAELDAQIERENTGELTEHERPLRALMAGSTIKATPRPSWNDRRALPPRPAKPPLTDEELAAARAELDAAARVGAPNE